MFPVDWNLSTQHILDNHQVAYSFCHYVFVSPLYVNNPFIHVLSSYFMADCTIHMYGCESLITLRINIKKNGFISLALFY